MGQYLFIPIFIFLSVLLYFTSGLSTGILDLIGLLAFSFVVEWIINKYILKEDKND
jgi:energy-converting hydrogenase Eha subunit F